MSFYDIQLPLCLQLYLYNRYKNNKTSNTNDENVSLNTVFNTADKYNNIVIFFILMCLFWVKFLNLIFSTHLAENIDSFVKVYVSLINK